MTDLNKLRQGLTCCINWENLKGHMPECESCPYADEHEGTCAEMTAILTDALDAITPRLLTLDEVIDRLDDAVYLEERGDGVAAIDSKSLTLDGVFGGESRDGKEWWDTIKSTMRYFASFTQRQKVMALPQTGDTSSLGLWLALLGMAGGGALMMRKRVHN